MYVMYNLSYVGGKHRRKFLILIFFEITNILSSPYHESLFHFLELVECLIGSFSFHLLSLLFMFDLESGAFG